MIDDPIGGGSGLPDPLPGQGFEQPAPRVSAVTPQATTASPQAAGGSNPGSSPPGNAPGGNENAFGAGLDSPSKEQGSAVKARSATRKRGAKKKSSRRRARPAGTGDEPEGSSGEAAASPQNSEPPAEEGSSKRPRSRRGSRGGRRQRSASDREPESQPEESSATADPGSGEPSARAGGARPRKSSRKVAGGRTRSRTGRSSKPSEPEGSEPAASSSEAPDGEQRGEGTEAKPRRKRSRRRRTPAATAAEPDIENDAAQPTEEDSGEDSSPEGDTPAAERSAKRRRRGSRGGRARRGASPVEIEIIPGEDDDLPELPDEAELIEEGDRSTRKARGSRSAADPRKKAKATKKARKKKASTEREEPAPVEEERTQHILVNAAETKEKRVAVVEDGRILDLQMTVDRYHSLVNDIYRGRIVNIEPAIGAAFVDFGQGRNGFLHTSDVMAVYGEKDWSLQKLLETQVDVDEWEEGSEKPTIGAEMTEAEEAEEAAAKGSKSRKKADSKAKASRGSSRRRARPRLPITDLLRKGQMVVVQITKDAIGDKGPTLTTYISIPGRYLVLMPSLARTGVSRKIEDERERRRLKRILTSLDIPDNMGVIVRTAGVGKTKTELKRDLDYLLASWEDFRKRLLAGRNPAPLYQESDVAIRTMRDLFSSKTESVIVDDSEVFDHMVNFTKRLMPEHVERIELGDPARPIFHSHGVEQEFERIFQRRVELPSGGSIVIDQTEALVAIDVNSGRTREEGAGFEDIALKTNLEAAPEIARQIRLRDLGGIIVLDFIDMLRSGSRRAVEKALREAMATDRARSKIGRISQFGLLELTRQRLGPGLSKLLYDTCPTCRGTGSQRITESCGQAILRRLGSAMTLKGFTKVEVRARPDIISYLKRNAGTQLRRLQERSKRELTLTEVPGQLEDSVLRYMRADGREVRPGGRRKR